MSISKNKFIWPTLSAIKLQLHRKCSIFNISDFPIQAYLKNIMLEHDNLNAKTNKTHEEAKRLFEIKPIINVLKQRNNLHDNIEALSNKQTDDKDKMEMIKKKGLSYLQRMTDVDRDLQSMLLEPKLTEGGVLLEVSAGAGDEAQLFARELFDMYKSYAEYKDWEVYTVSLEEPNSAGIRKGSMFIKGVGVPELMNIEIGVHRVQRIPATEKGGRIHTSTVSVAVTPNPTDVEAKIADQDFIFDTKRATGEGGQHVNTTDNGVRIRHTLTKVESQECTSEEKNDEIAIQKLRTDLWREEKEEQTLNSEREPQIGYSCLKDLVRTYDHAEDIVMEHRQGGGIAHHLLEFMEGDYKLEQMQNNLLRINWRQKFMDEMNQFAQKINSKTADTN